jgi:glycosyltransferase involved in cell wall biosynthesis
MDKTVTVVISSYRYGHLAAHCIESVLCQTVKPNRILFVDDGVGDCNHLIDLYPDVEFVIRENNMGTVDNFQDMLMRVETEYTMFLGADNWLRDDTLELLLKEDSDIVTYDIFVTGELKDKFYESGLNRGFIKYEGGYYWSRKGGHHGSMLYRTSIGQQAGYAASGGKNSEEDLVMWNRMLKLGATVSHVEQSLLYYRRHKENFIKF